MFVFGGLTFVKGGTSLIGPDRDGQAGLMRCSWHTKVPSFSLYVQLVEEQLQYCPAAVREQWLLHKTAYLQNDVFPRDAIRPEVPSGLLGTGKAFGARSVEHMMANDDVYILDADLSGSCGIAQAIGHRRYKELGVAEQDMVSFAGGLALAGKVPIVNTYSNFLKRGQMACCCW